MQGDQVPQDVFAHYESLQRYVGWTDDDASRVRSIGDMVRPAFAPLIDDFYEAIQREPQTARLITGGEQQIARLKKTLLKWLDELFSGPYDRQYVARRWQVGRRHVEIGLRQVFADAAMARLRDGLNVALQQNWMGGPGEVWLHVRSLNRLLDLELALIEDAYTVESLVEQRQAVRRQSEATFRNLVEAARCLIIILRCDKTIAYFSPFAERLSGFSSEQVLEHHFISTLIVDTHRPRAAEELRSVFDGGLPSVGFENEILCRDGHRRTILWNAQRLEDYEGEQAVLAVGHDITDLKTAQEQVLQSERLAAIGQMVAGLAHESRNAFQRSQACLEMLSLELEGRHGELELVERIQRALDHLHHLYEEVRSYAAPIHLSRSPCDLAHVWRGAWSHLELARKDKQITLRERIGNLDLVCEVDEFAIGQVFRNVLENAIAACPAQGEIVVSCRNTRIDDKPGIEVSVCDDGPGFSPDAAERAFEPFYTTKTKGTGLGMAIAQRIVHAHRGQISIGMSGPGAEIIITLPR